MAYPGQIGFEQVTSKGLFSIDGPNFGQTLMALYNTEYPIRTAAINKVFGLSQGFMGFQTTPQEVDDRFNPIHRMRQDNDLHLFDVLHEAKSEDHYSLLKRKARWEHGQRRVIADSSFPATFAAGLMVGTTDPLNLAVGLFTGGATTVFGAAFRAVASSVVVTGVNETLLHKTQVTRTLEESIANVAGDMIFSTAFGMGGYALARSFRYSPEQFAAALAQEYEYSGLPFRTGDPPAQLGIRPQTKWHNRAHIHYGTTARPGVAAYYRHDDHTIHIDENLVEDQFKRRAWRDPKPLQELDENGRPTGKTTQAEALADDHFIRDGEYNLQAWQDFVVQHEYLHTVHKIAPGESKAKYETRINDYALDLLKAGSLEGVHHTPITPGVHGIHADSIHNKFDEMGDDGVRQNTILDQMIKEGAFGHSRDARHSGYIREEDIAGPDRVDTDDVLAQAVEADSINARPEMQGHRRADFEEGGQALLDARDRVRSLTQRIADLKKNRQQLVDDRNDAAARGDDAEFERISDEIDANKQLERGLDAEIDEAYRAAADAKAKGPSAAKEKTPQARSDVDPQTGISDAQYLGSLSWTTKLLRAVGGIEKFRASPMLWVMNSKNAATRLFGMRLVPTPMSEGNLYGHTTPGDAATAINARHVELAEAMARGEKTWIEYRTGQEMEGKPSAIAILAESARAQKERLFREHETNKTRYINEYRARISRALRSGDLDEDPMIQKHVLYLREWIDNMTKEADALGMFGAGIKPGDVLSLAGSQSFLPRQWLQDVLLKSAEFDEAVTVIVSWQRANANAKDAPEYIAKLVLDPAKHEKFIKTQLLTVGRKLHSVEDFDIEATDVSGTFKGRGIWIDDLVLSGDNKAFGGRGTSFLENDINEILKKWVPHMHTDMELTRKFGSVGMESQFATIRRMAVDSAAENGETAFNKTLKGLDKKAPDEIVRTTKSAEKDIEKLSAMRDIMRGVYSLSGDPLAVSSRFARLLTDMTHLSLMGNVTISSIPDAGRILMVNRLEGLKTLRLAFKDFKRLRSELRGMRDVGVGMDMAMGTTVQALVHNGSIHRFTGLERVVGRLTDINFIINLLGPWNAVIKQAAGIATVSRIIKDLRKYKAGTLSRKHASKLSNAGVNEEFMERLLTLHEKYGDTVDGVEIPNAALWDLNDTSLGFDVSEFLLHFRRVLSREVDMQIVTPGAGDIPLALRKTPFNDAVQESLLGKVVTEEDLLNPGAKRYHEKLEPGEREHARSTVRREAAALYPHLGRVFGIYKSFIAGTWGRVLVPSLQNKDSTEFMGLATMIMLGGMAKTFKDLSYDRPGPESLKGFLLEGFDQSGLGSWFMFANSQGEALLDTGLRPLLGMPRFAPSLRWQASSVLGASVGQLIRAGRLAGDAGSFAMGEDFSSSSATNAYRMLPGQSLFYLRLHNLFKFRNTSDEVFGAGNAVGDTG